MTTVNYGPILPLLLVLFVAIQHLGFMVLESFLWQTPTGLKIFGLTPEEAKLMAPLAANQGLYNGFLAAGLLWSLWCVVQAPAMARPLMIFFLGCVLVAGLVGGATVKPSIWVIQAVPAAIALVVLAVGL